MVLLTTSDEWQRQTSLLLQARPTTTRITTKYNIPNLDSPKYQKPKKRKRDAEPEEKDAATIARVPRAILTLKTYDPESGVVLKFETDRAAEVGRLVGGLGRVGRYMAALPKKDEPADAAMEDVKASDEQIAEVTKDTAHPAGDAKPQQSAVGGGGGKKKKKNKK